MPAAETISVKTLPIDRKRQIAPADFHREHVLGIGKPVIVTDATDGWRARSTWTFESFKHAYGSDFAFAAHGQGDDVGKLTRLGTYIDFLDDPAGLPGFWVSLKDMRAIEPVRERTESPLYLTGWHGFQRHPVLYTDIVPPPYFIPDWTLSLEPALRDLLETTCGRYYWVIFIGAAGTLSALHRDFWSTHSYLAQIRGRKRVLLFSPEDSTFLYDGGVNPEQPDLKRFPLFEGATMYEGVIGPGDVLYTPPGWWHHVRALDSSMTVSHNFFNEVNFSAHLERLIRRLPIMAKAIEASPTLRRALQIEWRSNGFAETARYIEP